MVKSSYAGKIRDVPHGLDTSRPLKSMSPELLFGNGNVDVATRIRIDNSIVVEHVHSIYSVSKERRSNGCLESNRAWMWANPWLVL